MYVSALKADAYIVHPKLYFVSNVHVIMHVCGQSVQRVVLESSAVRPASVRMGAGVTTSLEDADAWPRGPESGAKRVSRLSQIHLYPI